MSILCIIMVIIPLVACGGGSSSSDPTAGNIVGVGSANIGIGGGTVTTTDTIAAVLIPPGALTNSTPITAAFATAPAASAAVGDYLASLSPDGTRFSSPARLSVQVDPAWLPDEWSLDGLQLAFWSGGQWSPVTTIVASSSSSLEAQIDHFSTWAVVPRGGSDSSPDYSWERNSSGCLRTTNSQYNSLLGSLANALFGSTPTNSLGCVTGVYLEDGYSKFLASMRNHAGIDLKASEGTAVYAPFDGKVKFQALDAQANPPTSTLTIESTNSSTPYRLLLLHCRSHEQVRGSQTLANPPAVGVDVLRGDRICLTGKVGAASPHLHVELKPIGQDLNNLRAMSGSRGACKTSSFPDGWNRPTQSYSKLTSPGCSLSDIRQNTLDPTNFLISQFRDDFNGTSLDNGRWTVEAFNGLLATYTVNSGFLEFNVAGGSCGFCGVADGARLVPRVDRVTGDFEAIVGFEELLRESRDSSRSLGSVQFLLTGAHSELGVYVVGDAIGNSGTPGHRIWLYYQINGSITFAGLKDIEIGQYYAMEFRIRRIGGIGQLGYRLAGETSWTEVPVSAAFPTDDPLRPSVVVGTGDGGGTQMNSQLRARLDYVSIVR